MYLRRFRCGLGTFLPQTRGSSSGLGRGYHSAGVVEILGELGFDVGDGNLFFLVHWK